MIISIFFRCHQLTPQALNSWNAAYNRNIPRFSFKQMSMQWEYCRSGSTTYRYQLDPSMMQEGSLPEKMFLSFTDAQSFLGSFKRHSGWMSGEIFHCKTTKCYIIFWIVITGNFIKSITWERGNTSPAITLNAETSLRQIWSFSMNEANIDPFKETLPLMEPNRYAFNTFGLIVDCSRSHTEMDSTPIKDGRMELLFTFKVCNCCL